MELDPLLWSQSRYFSGRHCYLYPSRSLPSYLFNINWHPPTNSQNYQAVSFLDISPPVYRTFFPALSLLPHKQELANFSYIEPDQSTPLTYPANFLNIRFNMVYILFFNNIPVHPSVWEIRFHTRKPCPIRIWKMYMTTGATVSNHAGGLFVSRFSKTLKVMIRPVWPVVISRQNY
jgi:hypothetical protein